MGYEIVNWEIVNWLASENGFRVHIAVLILLLMGGFGFPMPEDIPLLLGGVAASKNIVSLRAIFLTCYLGVLLADQIVFLIGYFFGQKLLAAGTRSPFFPSITEERLNVVREGLRKRRLFYIFLGRHLFPLRTATFLSAGALRIPYLEFLIADAFAALLSVTMVVGIGYMLGSRLTPEVVQHFVHKSHLYLLIITLICILFWVLNRAIKRRRVVK